MYKLKRRGLSLQPCFTPLWQGKLAESLLFAITLQEAFPYIDCKIFNILRLFPMASSLVQSELWFTESKALVKLTKQA